MDVCSPEYLRQPAVFFVQGQALTAGANQRCFKYSQAVLQTYQNQHEGELTLPSAELLLANEVVVSADLFSLHDSCLGRCTTCHSGLPTRRHVQTVAEGVQAGR